MANKNSNIENPIANDIKPKVLTIKQIKEKIKQVIEKHQIKDVFL